MTKPEKLKLARLRARLRATGVDVDLQAGVIEGYVLAESRIARLRAEEAQAVRVGRSGPEVRALNVALGEQRRLHQILFGRRSQQAEPMPTPTELAEEKRLAEADAAWRLCFRQHGFGEGSRQDAVEANFGPPSWNAILYDSPERQEQAEAAIEANRVRYLRPRRVRR
jgi:hypothetical protein